MFLNIKAIYILIHNNPPPNDFVEWNLLWYPHILHSSNICEILLYNRQLIVITYEPIYIVLKIVAKQDYLHYIYMYSTSVTVLVGEVKLLEGHCPSRLNRQGQVASYIFNNCDRPSGPCQVTWKTSPESGHLSVCRDWLSAVNCVSLPTRKEWVPYFMMTSWNGNIFRVTGHLCGEFTGHRWIPRTKASDAELWCFLWSPPE